MIKQVSAAFLVLALLGALIAISESESSAVGNGVIPADVGDCAYDCQGCQDGTCPPRRGLFGGNRRSITRNGNVNVELFNGLGSGRSGGLGNGSQGSDSNPFTPDLQPVPENDFTPITSDEMGEDFADDYAQPNDYIDIDVENDPQPRRRLFQRRTRSAEPRAPRQKRDGFFRRFFKCLFNRGC